MRKYTLILSKLLIISCSVAAQTQKEQESLDQSFPKGSQIKSENFTGIAYLHPVISGDSLSPNSVAYVTFEPNARSKWHSHPDGQIIVVVEGESFYQEKGEGKKVLKKGDVVKCKGNVPHWHGASKNSATIQLVFTSIKNGATDWMNVVSDAEYNSMTFK